MGGASAVFSLGLDLLLATALVQLATNHPFRGALLLAGVLLARWFLLIIQSQWSKATKHSLQHQLRRTLSQHFFTPSPERLQARGDLASAIESAAQMPSLNMLKWSSRAILLGVVVVFVADGWLSLLIVVGLMALSVPFYLAAGKKSEVAAERYEHRRRILEARQLELLRNSVELRSLGALRYGASEIEAITSREHEAAASAISITMQSSLVTEFLSGVSIGLVAMVVGFGLLGGRISLLRALAGVLVTSDIFLHIRRFGQEFHRQENATVAAQLLHAPTHINQQFSSDVVFSASQVKVLDDSVPLSFTVTPGSRLLVAGPSGIGKSSLLAALVGWSTPVSGTVRRTTNSIGFISSSSALLAGTLEENLTLGNSVDYPVLQHLLSELGLGERFGDLSYVISPSGEGVSDGERIRLLVARALLQNADVLVLDDISGLLDQDSLENVRRVLRSRPELTVVEAAVDEGILPDSPVIEAQRV